jgi:hypothetical protein
MKPLHVTILLAVIAVLGILFVTGYFDKKQAVQQLTTGIKRKDDTTTHWRDLYNTEHASNISLQQDLQTTRIIHEKELKEAAVRLNVKDKQIQNLNQFVATLQASFTAPVDTTRRGDTTASTIHVDPFSVFNTFTIGDKQTVNYKITVPIRLTQYWKRPHSFLGIRYGDPVNYIDGYSTNKNVRIDSLSNVRILAKPPGRWGVGPYFGYGTNGTGFTWNAGFSIHYSLIRW